MKHYELKSGKFLFNIEEYGSAFEVANLNSQREVTKQCEGRRLTDKDVRGDKDFYGVSSISEAHDLLKNGWTQEVERMTATLKKAHTMMAQKRVGFRNDVEGFAPVVPLAMMNVPQSMINMTMKPIKSKVVKIYYSIEDRASTPSKKFLDRGRKIMEAIIMLERSGYRCELHSIQAFCDDDHDRADILLIRVKEANQPLDIKRVMFPFTHPAMFRVIGFTWQDKCPTAKFIHNRGVPFHVIGDYNKKFTDAFGSECIYLDPKIADKGVEEIKNTIINGR